MVRILSTSKRCKAKYPRSNNNPKHIYLLNAAKLVPATVMIVSAQRGIFPWIIKRKYFVLKTKKNCMLMLWYMETIINAPNYKNVESSKNNQQYFPTCFMPLKRWENRFFLLKIVIEKPSLKFCSVELTLNLHLYISRNGFNILKWNQYNFNHLWMRNTLSILHFSF